MHKACVPRGTVLTYYITNPYLCSQMKELIARILAWMEYRKMSQGDLSRESGILQPRLSVLLKGEQASVHPRTLRKIASGLGIEPHDLDRMPPSTGDIFEKSDKPIDLEQFFREWTVAVGDRVLTDADKESILFAVYARMHKGNNSGGGKNVKTGT